MTEAIGAVIGTRQKAAGPLDFHVHLQEGEELQLDDIVHVESQRGDGEAVDFYGVVDQVRTVQEGSEYDSDAQDVAGDDPAIPSRRSMSARVAVTRVEPERLVPPDPGDRANLARGAAREKALFFDRMERRFAAGLSRDGEPVWANLGFVDGTHGAHVNISGISGVATKTSYAAFLLHSLFEGRTGGERTLSPEARAVIFNVKGEDLFFLDRRNGRFGGDGGREGFEAMGLPAEPFADIAFYSPARDLIADRPEPSARQRADGVVAYAWSLHEFCKRRYLRYFFTRDDGSEQTLDAAERATDYLERCRVQYDGAVETPIGAVRIGSLDDLAAYFGDEDNDGAWTGGAHPGSVDAFRRRLRAVRKHAGPLVRALPREQAERHRIPIGAHPEGDPPADPPRVAVVDMSRLTDRARRFVVGATLQQLMDEREERQPEWPFFVVLDELNKYAPRQGGGPIKDALVDVAERGRSLRVILIGAQQTASEIEPRIVSNCSLRVAGRVDAAEAAHGAYQWLGDGEARRRAALLKPGSMFLSQPDVPAPLLTRFPMPPWATRGEEALEPEGEALPPGVVR